MRSRAGVVVWSSVLLAMSCAALAPAFSGRLLVVPVALLVLVLTVAGTVGLLVLARVARLRPLTGTAVVGLLLVVAALLLLRTGDPTLPGSDLPSWRRTVGMGVLSPLVDAVPLLLTAPVPAPPEPLLLTPVVLLVALVTLAVTALVLRPSSWLLAPVAGAAALYAAGLALGAGTVDRSGVLAAALVLTAVAGWALLGRTHAPGTTAVQRLRPGRGTLPLAAATAATALVAVVGASLPDGHLVRPARPGRHPAAPAAGHQPDAGRHALGRGDRHRAVRGVRPGPAADAPRGAAAVRRRQLGVQRRAHRGGRAGRAGPAGRRGERRGRRRRAGRRPHRAVGAERGAAGVVQPARRRPGPVQRLGPGARRAGARGHLLGALRARHPGRRRPGPGDRAVRPAGGALPRGPARPAGPGRLRPGGDGDRAHADGAGLGDRAGRLRPRARPGRRQRELVPAGAGVPARPGQLRRAAGHQRAVRHLVRGARAGGRPADAGRRRLRRPRRRGARGLGGRRDRPRARHQRRRPGVGRGLLRGPRLGGLRPDAGRAEHDHLAGAPERARPAGRAGGARRTT